MKLLKPLLFFLLQVTYQEEVIEAESVVNTAELPEHLTAATFKSQLLTRKVSLVEFYSPYCSHCKQFAPKWESTYKNNQEYFEGANLGFYQVNCVESGDLCAEQDIRAYPSMKLYSSDAIAIKDYRDQRTEESLVKFMKKNENQDTSVYADLTKYIGLNEFLVQVEAISEKPEVFVFSPTDEKVKSIDELVKLSDYDNEMVNTIKLISEKYDTYIINSHEHWHTYEKFKLDDASKLTFFLKLPKREILSFIKYDFNEQDENFLSMFLNWCDQMVSISSLKNISINDIFTKSNNIGPIEYLPSELPYDPSLIYENTFVYFYDPETTFEEDWELLPHLLETFAKLHNVRLYVCKDDFKKFTHLFSNIVQQNFQDIPGEQFNEYQYIVDSITSIPTFVKLNPHFPVLSLYQNFGPNEVRDFWRVSDWIKENSFPLIYDFKRQNNELYNDQDSLIVLQVIDDYQQLIPTFKIAKDYQYILNNFKYEQLEIERKLKKEEIEAFKKSKFYNVDEYVRKTIKEIYPLNQHFHNVKFAYVFENQTSILSDYGLNINSRTYKTDDVLIVDRSTLFYYDSTATSQLSAAVNPLDITYTLLALNNAKDFELIPLLRSSPFGLKFRFLDNFHQFGASGYFLLILISSGAFALYRIRRRSANSLNDGNHRYGILDDPTKFD